MLNFLRVDSDRSLSDWLAILKCSPRNGGNRAWRVLVHVSPVHVHIRSSIDDRGVVDIRDFRSVDHSGIRYVDVRHVNFARAVRGHPHVARTQRKPSHTDSGGTAEFDGRRYRPASNERDQRGRIDRPNVDGASNRKGPRHPTPTAARHNCPSSIVEWRKTPGLVFDPCPTPWSNEGPMPVVIRSPTCLNSIRNPHMAIFSIFAPRSMIVEIFVADHVGRNILRRRKPLFTSIALDVPLLKLVWLRERLRVVADLIRSGESVLLTGSGIVSLATRSYFGRAAFDGHSAGTTIRAYVNAIFTWTQNRECQIGSINLVAFVIFQMTHAQRRGALCHLDLDSLICQVQERNGCLR